MYQYLQQAKWIWAKGYDRPNMFLVARCPDRIPADAAGEWTLHISVDADFALLCEWEGRQEWIAFGQFPDYASHKVCEVRHIDASVLRGATLYLLLTSQNCDTSTDRKERAGVIFSLRDAQGRCIWASDGGTELYHTSRHRDEGVPLVTGQLGFSFDIDLTAPLCGHRCEVELLQNMPTELYPRPIAPLKMGERLPGVPVLQTAFAEQQDLPDTAFGMRMQCARFLADGEDGDGQAYIYDLGAEQVGFLSLEITAAQDTDVLIGWGEHLADGRVRTDISGRCFGARCHLRAGENHLLYPLRRLGLRFLQLNVYAPADGVTITYTGICPVDYPLPPAKEYPYTAQSGLPRAIYETCLRTLRMCLHDHYEDCPWREQALYTMDSRNQMLCGYYAYGETAAPRASLELIARSLREDALLELCSPARCSITIPAFSAMFVVQLAEYVDFSKDIDGVRELLLPTAQRIVDGFVARMDHAHGGLLKCYPEERHWNFYEWQEGLSGSISGSVKDEDMTYDAPLCCFVSLAMEALTRLYGYFGMDAARKQLQTTRIQLNRAIHESFYDDKTAVYEGYLRLRDGYRYHRAQLTQALAIVCGACPPAELNRARERLAYDKTLLPVTLSHSIFRYDALLADKTYLPMVLDEIERVWGGMLQAGATTFWETAAGERDFSNAGSLCHGWSAIPIYVYWKYATNGKN